MSKGYTENLNDLDYLYRVSFLIREKIIKLDKLEIMTKDAMKLRKKLMQMNYDFNKKIRDLSIQHITKGNSKFKIDENGQKKKQKKKIVDNVIDKHKKFNRFDSFANKAYILN